MAGKRQRFHQDSPFLGPAGPLLAPLAHPHAPPPSPSHQALAQYAADASAACDASNYTAPVCLLSLGGHVLGGA